MHEPPQQRCVSMHSGMQVEGGGPLSVRGGTPVSTRAVHMPVKTHAPSQHSCVAAQAGSHAVPPPAHPGANAASETRSANAPTQEARFTSEFMSSTSKLVLSLVRSRPH